MILKADPKYPIHRAYVVKLSSDATPDQQRGRIENLVTGQQQEFTSGQELLNLIAQGLGMNHSDQ